MLEESDSESSELQLVVQSAVVTTYTEFASRLKGLPDTASEVNYVAFSLFQNVVWEIFHRLSPLPGQAGMAWNQLDAVWQGLAGYIQVTDNTTHRPIVTKVKGGVNIASALQISVLSAISLSAFGGYAFAASFFAGFVLSLEDTAYAIRRCIDDNYFVEDGLKKLVKNNATIEALQAEIKLVEQQPNVKDSWTLKKILASKKSRLKTLEQETYELQDELMFKILKKKVTWPSLLDECHEDPTLGGFLGNKTYQYQSKKYMGLNDKEMHTAMKRKLQLNIGRALKNNLHWGLAFAGTLLICIPGCQPIGSIIIVVAAALYLEKFAEPVVGIIKNRFFSGNKNQEYTIDSPTESPDSSKREEFPSSPGEEGMSPS